MSMPEVMARRVGYRLKLAQNALRIAMDEALREAGITAPQYAVLSAVDLDPGISNATLARAAFVTPQTMQGIIANLERAGMLQRASDPDHGRVKRASLTARGRSALATAHRSVAVVENLMLSGLSGEEAEILGSLLERAAQNLRAARSKTGHAR